MGFKTIAATKGEQQSDYALVFNRDRLSIVKLTTAVYPGHLCSNLDRVQAFERKAKMSMESITISWVKIIKAKANQRSIINFVQLSFSVAGASFWTRLPPSAPADGSFYSILLLPFSFLKIVSFPGANQTKSASVGPRRYINT